MQVYSPSPDFTPLYYVTRFTKRQTIRRFWGRSVLQMEMPISDDAVCYLQKSCWIVDDKGEPFIIRNITQNETSVTVIAYGGHWGFEGRITIPSTGNYAIEVSGSADVVVKEFINQTLNNVNDPQEKRDLKITTAISQPGTIISDQSRLKNLGDEVVRILNPAGRGEKFTFTGTGIKFDTYPGEDKSDGCVFDVRYKNIKNYEYTLDATSTQTTAIVGGAGEGAAREIHIKGEDVTGWERREIFVDARDLNTGDTNKLSERASQAIISEEKKYTTTAAANSNIIYNQDYHLGDIVSMNVPVKTYEEVNGFFKPKQEIVKMKTRIIEVIETCEEGTETIELTVGDNVIKSETTQLKSDVAQLKSVENAFPAGFIMLYAGTTAPIGYFIANGQTVSRTTYSSLFNVIGTTYGAGDGSTTFALPNMCGRVPVGLSTETEFNTLGKTSGEKSIKLTVAEMPEHSHSFHGVNDGTTVNVQWSNYPIRMYQDKATNWPSGSGIDSNGGDQPHNNLQPYITLNYIIKY